VFEVPRAPRAIIEATLEAWRLRRIEAR